MENCKNCNQDLTGKFCANCGQPATLKRIDSHYIQHEIEHVLHLDRGIFYTIKELFLRPGNSIHSFISGDRNRLVKPIIFIIICSLFYMIFEHYFHIEQGYVDMHGPKGSTYNTINAWVQNHYGYANIIMGVFIALWIKIFFRKYDYNFYEILILLCYVMGIGMLIISIFIIIEGFTKVHLLRIGSAVGCVYSIWAIANFYDKNKFSSYPKAAAAYLIGLMTYSLVISLIGVGIDSFK